MKEEDGSVMLVYVKCENEHSKCWLCWLKSVMYFLSDTVTLMPLVFPFLLTKASH